MSIAKKFGCSIREAVECIEKIENEINELRREGEKRLGTQRESQQNCTLAKEKKKLRK